MKGLVRFVSLLIVCLLAAAPVAGCGGAGRESISSAFVDAVTSGEEDASSAAESAFAVSDDVGTREDVSAAAESAADDSSEPAGGGKLPEQTDIWDTTVWILASNHSAHAGYEYGATGLESERCADSVSEAFLQRAERIESEYGLKAEVTLENGLGAAADVIRQFTLAELDEYQIVADGLFSLLQPCMGELFYDLRQIDESYIDLSADYWDRDAVRALSVNGGLTVLTGDAVVSDDAATIVLYCNRALLEENGLADPAALAETGEWTLDALYALCRQSAVQVSEGFLMSFAPEDGDVWGMVTPDWLGCAFMYGAGQTMAGKDADDRPVLRIDDAQNVAAWRKVSAMLYDRSCVGVAGHYGKWESVIEKAYRIFTNGNALFMPGMLSLLEDGTLEDVSFPLGVLPLPKLDENQTDFISVGDVYQMPFFALPVTNPEPSAACRLLEAMAADGEACADAYRAKLLTGLSQADAARNARMLALALSRRIYDLGAIYTPDENSFGAWQFYIRMIGVSSFDILLLYEVEKADFQAHLDAAAARFHARGQQDRR